MNLIVGTGSDRKCWYKVMAGTVQGGRAAAATNKSKYGEDFYGRIGSKGGKKEVPKGFATMDRSKHIAASVKGGTISRRKPRKI